MMRKVSVLVTILAVVACVPAFGTVAFMTGFDGPGLDANLQDPDGAFVVDGVAWNTTGNRRYISTLDASYREVANWTAELVFISPSGEHGGIYCGLGSAVPDPGFYDEPSNSIFVNLIHLEWHPDGMLVQKHTDGGASTTTLQTFPRYAANGTHRMILSKAGDNLTLALDLNNDGGTDYTSNVYSLSSDAPFLNDTNSRIFFGTSESSVQFDSLTVVPEPATMGLLLLGAVGLFRRTWRVCG